MPGVIRTAVIKSAPGNGVRVTANVAVAAEDFGTVVEIGNDHDVGLVIAHARFEPSLPLARIIGRTQVRVPVTAPNLNATELVY